MAESELAAQAREAARENRDSKGQQQSHEQYHNHERNSSGSLAEQCRELAQEERPPTYWRDFIEQQRKSNDGGDQGVSHSLADQARAAGTREPGDGQDLDRSHGRDR